MICLPILHVVLLFCFVIGITAWFISFTETKRYNKYLNKHHYYDSSDTESYDKHVPVKNDHQGNISQKNEIRNRDQNVLYNSFTAPERRVPEYEYPTKFIQTQINTPTRGYPDEYQLLGNVFRDSTETAYNLFGRQKYPGSMQYEYYVSGHDVNGSSVKIPISVYGDKEINDNDVINIPGTNKSKGEFRVKLYNINTPRYIPIL